MKHELKILPTYFKEVQEGRKTFEVRKNDRNFQSGDTVILKEWDSLKEYSGLELSFKIGYVLHLSGFFGGQDEYVILSLVKE